MLKLTNIVDMLLVFILMHLACIKVYKGFSHYVSFDGLTTGISEEA